MQNLIHLLLLEFFLELGYFPILKHMVQLSFAQNHRQYQKLIFDRIKEEVLDFQQLVNIVKEFDKDLADSLQIRFDKSMGQFELEENLN